MTMATSGALEGIRILDFTQMMLGPYATQTLADLGADVIKVERPGVGEWERSLEMMGELVGTDSAAFLAMNRNKRSVTLDLKSQAGVQAALSLVEHCDVVVENFRPGVLERLGVGYAQAKSHNERVIYASGSGWGQSGPLAEQGRPGQDLLIQAMSGLAFNAGTASDPPVAAGSSVVDALTAQSLTIGVLAALVARDRHGIGQRVEVDLFSTAMAAQCQEISAMVNQKTPAERSAAGIAQPWLSAPFGFYRTADGWLAVAMAPLDVVGTATGVADLGSYDAWAERDEVKRRLDDVFPSRPTDEWLDRLLAAGVWCAPARTTWEAVTELRQEQHPLIVEVDHPTAGTLELIGSPIGLSATPWTLRRPPPTIGQHTGEVARELLGEESYRRLSQAGAFG